MSTNRITIGFQREAGLTVRAVDLARTLLEIEFRDGGQRNEPRLREDSELAERIEAGTRRGQYVDADRLLKG